MPAQISLLTAVLLVIASMLGSGILTTTGSIVSCVKSADAVIFVWGIAGLHALFGAYCYGSIMRRMPVNGGEASMLKKFFTPALGEIAGWVSFIVGFAASNAATAIGFGAYLEKAVPNFTMELKVPALVAIVAVTALHSLTGPLGLRIQTGMAALKFAMLLGLMVWGLSFAPMPAVLSADAAISATPFGSAWGVAIMLSMFAYLGWSAAIYSAAETRDARRNVPRAMMIGTLVVLLLYVGVNLAVLRHIPISELASEKAVMELLAKKLFGSGVAEIFSGVVAFALLSSLGVSAFLGPRVLKTMLQWYRKSPSREQAPGLLLIWLQAAISMIMIVSGTFEQILTVTGFLLGVFPIIAVLGLYTRVANESHPVSALTRIVAVPIFISGSALILVLGAIEKPGEMTVAAAILFLIYMLRRCVSGGLARDIAENEKSSTSHTDQSP